MSISINSLYFYYFQVFYDKMKDAQQEIKATVTVNTSDMATKAHEDKEQGKDLEKVSKKRISGEEWNDHPLTTFFSFILLFFMY